MKPWTTREIALLREGKVTEIKRTMFAIRAQAKRFGIHINQFNHVYKGFWQTEEGLKMLRGETPITFQCSRTNITSRRAYCKKKGLL